MNHLTECPSAEEILRNHFRTMIITDFVDRNGEKGQIATLVSHTGMFDETVMGIDRGLRSGGKAVKWQSRVFTVQGGKIRNTITYKPVCLNENNV